MGEVRQLMRYMPIAAVAALALSPSPAAATWEGKPGLVAYQTVDRLNTIRPDGTHRRPIGDTFDVNGFDWSPNGHAIVWAGTDALWQVRADGTHRRRITSQDF